MSAFFKYCHQFCYFYSTFTKPNFKYFLNSSILSFFLPSMHYTSNLIPHNYSSSQKLNFSTILLILNTVTLIYLIFLFTSLILLTIFPSIHFHFIIFIISQASHYFELTIFSLLPLISPLDIPMKEWFIYSGGQLISGFERLILYINTSVECFYWFLKYYFNN